MQAPRLLAAVFLAGMALGPTLRSADSVDLSGKWRLQLDREDVGVGARWFDLTLAGSALLPRLASVPGHRHDPADRRDEVGLGGIIDRSYFSAPEYAPYRVPGNIKVPFWLQPESTYVGAAWFQRDLAVPAAWAGRRVTVTLERPHWKTSLWLDGRACGSNDSLSVAHVYDLGASVTPGAHVLTLRVDNTLAPDIGENSHSVSDHTQGNWNGIEGRIELGETQPVWIADLQAYPDARDHRVFARGRVAALAGRALPATVSLKAGPSGSAPLGTIQAAVAPDGSFSAEYPLGPDAPLWDEFDPHVCNLSASLANGERRTVAFGLRDLSVSGRELENNGRRIFLRGTLECAANPRTGSPPVDLESWKRFFDVVKAHGLNHVRFHSWCPPEAAFRAADLLGVYLQVEMASWPNQSTTLGDGKPVDRWLDAETDRILSAYGSHPSFAFVSACNEPRGRRRGPLALGLDHPPPRD